jgi:hypothetical protein
MATNTKVEMPPTIGNTISRGMAIIEESSRQREDMSK